MYFHLFLQNIGCCYHIHNQNDSIFLFTTLIFKLQSNNSFEDGKYRSHSSIPSSLRICHQSESNNHQHSPWYDCIYPQVLNLNITLSPNQQDEARKMSSSLKEMSSILQFIHQKYKQFQYFSYYHMRCIKHAMQFLLRISISNQSISQTPKNKLRCHPVVFLLNLIHLLLPSIFQRVLKLYVLFWVPLIPKMLSTSQLLY